MMAAETEALHVKISGTVQGVGFRPFVYRLADRLNLKGRVNNNSSGVDIKVEGPPGKLEKFVDSLRRDNPPPARIESFECSEYRPVNYSDFKIDKSSSEEKVAVDILPDLATCDDCLQELFDPDDRRHRYPFINCTNCGPRYSIIESLPYDRPSTTMKKFEMCPECKTEYENPLDRRFHAQPNACPKCGPRLKWTGARGTAGEQDNLALERAIAAIKQGEVVAVKGLGGFHLLARASSPGAVQKLREGKNRPAKPLALMYPSREAIEEDCQLNEKEKELLNSPQAPIVLLEKKEEISVAKSVAPGVADLGVMLPYTPLHYLLLEGLNFPVVATSGNISGEPICLDNDEAIEKLGHFVAGFLLHDRPIARRVDDSVVRIITGFVQVIRRARGYAPGPVGEIEIEENLLAAGPRLKNTVGFTRNQNIISSQHLGELETSAAVDNYEDTIRDLKKIYELDFDFAATDMHPDYYSTVYAQNQDLKTISVQHHHAHAAGSLLDNRLEGPALAVCWDGTGYGTDGTIWGGEILRADREQFTRIAHLRQFNLPGGDKAVLDPRRSLLGLLFEGDGISRELLVEELALFTAPELSTLTGALKNNLNSPETSSMGRFFDAFSVLLGLPAKVDYSGQAPARLEKLARSFYAENSDETGDLQFDISPKEGCYILDWQPVITEVIDSLEPGNKGKIACSFHRALADLIVKISRRENLENVLLTGGCFQNRLLTELAVEQLDEAGFTPHIHKNIPPNDGGIAAGQAVVVAEKLKSINT